ncbi:hypothetical protein ACT7DD_31350 [Bacillus paranthracis]
MRETSSVRGMKNLKKMYLGDEIEGEDNLNAWFILWRVSDISS